MLKHLLSVGLSLAALLACSAAGAPQPGPAANPSPPVVVIRGFAGEIYLVSAPPAAAPGASTATPKCWALYVAASNQSPAPFSNAPFVSEGSPPCHEFAVMPTKKALTVGFALGARASFGPATATKWSSSTPVDNVPPDPHDDRIAVTVQDGAPGTSAKPVRYVVNPGSHVFAVSDPVREPRVVTTAASATRLDDDTKAGWIFTLDVPWTEVLADFYGPRDLRIDVEILPSGTSTGALHAQFDVALNVERAFGPGTRRNDALAAGDDRRYFAFTKLAQVQFSGPSQPPPATFPPGFKAKPFKTDPSPPAFPAITADFSHPVTEHAFVGGTAFQHNAFVQSQQKNIVAAVDASTGLKKPADLAKCGSCSSFQQLYGPVFTLRHASDALKAPMKQVGGDDEPFALTKLPDLEFGSLLQYSNGGSTTTLSKIYWNVPKPFDDTVLATTYVKGTLRVDALTVSNSNTLPFVAPPTGTPAPVLPFARPTPPALASHVASYGLAVAFDNPRAAGVVAGDSPSSREQLASSDASGLLRIAYDASDRRMNVVTGVHLERSQYDGAGALGTIQGTFAYRGSGIGYQQPNGDAIGYPGVGGPFVSLAAKRQTAGSDGTALARPSFTFTGYSLRNRLGDGVLAGDATISVDLSRQFSVSAEIARARISDPLLAAQQLGLNYPFVQQIFFTETPAIAVATRRDLRDNTFNIAYRSVPDRNQKTKLQVSASAGVDVGHLAPTCANPTSTLVGCVVNRPLNNIVAGGSIVWGDFTLAGSYAPSLTQQTDRLSSPERVYNVFLSNRLNACTTLLVTSSNDSGTLDIATIGKLKRIVTGELAIESPGTKPGVGNLAASSTLVFGYSNLDSLSSITATNPRGIGVIQDFFPSHDSRVFAYIRFGNPAFKGSLAPSCTKFVPTRPTFTVTGGAAPAAYAAFDEEIRAFMERNGISAGQLAVARGGTIVFSHAYTSTADLNYPITQPSSIMRVASNSKALVTAAITKLYAAGVLTRDTKVYPYLGVTHALLPNQTLDPRSNAITVQNLVDHLGGLPGDGADAPEFNMWSIEVAAGLSGPLTKAQFTSYLYGLALSSPPGTSYQYSNDGYYLLARVIEKAVGRDYFDWVNENVLAPIGVTDAVVAATAADGRRANEVLYDDPGSGRSVLTPQLDVKLPRAYGGSTYMEDLDGPAAIVLSAESLAKFAGTYNVYGLGPRTAGKWRGGSLPGTRSLMESLPDGLDFAFIFNRRVDKSGSEFDIGPLQKYLEAHL
jgi:CubicO group peptidase (beta-lactamase class C family)